MIDAYLLAGVAAAALIAYGVLAGADFGGGVWDFLAAGPRRAEQRDAIARAMTPVWEANHVWLILVIVVMFTGFPVAFAAVSVGLFVPLHLVLIGIILRGAAFVFRAYGPKGRPGTLPWGAMFGAASMLTPALLGMALGAVSSGGLRVRADESVYTAGATWLSPLAVTIGAFALASCAYLAAVFLTVETDGDLRDDFRIRALGAGTVLVSLSALALPLIARDAPHLWRGLASARVLPVVSLGVIAALASGIAIRSRWFRLARATAVAHVSLLLAGWCMAEAPYLVFPDVTIASAAAPRATIRFVLWSLPVGAALIGPSLWFLLRVFKSEATRER